MGMILGTMILVYILISFGVSFLIYKFSKKKILSSIIFILLVTFPFWDLIAQKAIKTYYLDSGLLEPKIYSMPEIDENGMIESIGFDKGLLFYHAMYYHLKNKQNFEKYLMEEINIKFQNRISNYYEFYYPFNNRNVFCKIYVKKKTYEFSDEKIDARYQILKNQEIDLFFGLAKKRTYKIIDKKFGSKILANVYGYSFTRTKNISRYVRNNLLMLSSDNVEFFKIQPFNNISKVLNRLFSLNIEIQEYKIIQGENKNG